MMRNKHIELMDAASNASGLDRQVASARLDGFRTAWELCSGDHLAWVRHAMQHEATFAEGVASCCGVRMEDNTQ